MNKIRTLIRAPFLVNAGYGNHSRQILQAFLSDPLFDLSVENLNWGACSFIVQDSPLKQTILQLMAKRTEAKRRNQENWDLSVQVTIPNEFQRLAKINIGVTAGIETDRVSHVWLQKINEMDLVIVPSKHSADVIKSTIVDWTNQENGESGQISAKTPVVICNEGIDTKIFRKLKYDELSESIKQLKLEPDFNFLHIGQWGGGSFGEDRKNISNMLKYFIESFHGRKDVGLILKTNMTKNSLIDQRNVLNRLNDIKAKYDEKLVPPIYLLHGSMTDYEMASLYNHSRIKAFISMTHGEGFGLPLLEAAACGLPILATNWSGHLDFLKDDKFIPINYTMKEIPEAAVWGDILIKGSHWAEIDENDAKQRMQKIVSKPYYKPSEWARELAVDVKDNFDIEATNRKFLNTIKRHILEKTLDKMSPVEYLKNFVDTPESFNVIYTMPMSAGDVFVSTAVIDGLKKELPSDTKIYFATSEQYMRILQGNPSIHKVIPWHDMMINIDILESVFDLALTPNTSTHYVFSNWIRRGQGRLLAEEYASHCQCELGDYFIEEEKHDFSLNGSYATLHVGSGSNKWSARKYLHWQEVVDNLKACVTNLKIVQIGAEDDMKIKNVDMDLTGKTNYNQLATLMKDAILHIGIDSFPMHLASAYKKSLVAVFGSSYAKSTGPWYKDKTINHILLETTNRFTCNKACYKNECFVDKDYPCLNEIPPKYVFDSCLKLLRELNA